MHGVHISTREGCKAYHQPCWPRRTRCKEGNLAYFYDHYGYERFDIVCQFDADHVPETSYLSTLLPAFLDPQVGYAALPSICGTNSEVSWAVRGRLYQEAYMHGPLGASMSGIALPCCIGSHYAIRTAALREVGGIGTELNEDFSTSYIMTACGHRGVFLLDTIANGDGPANLEDCMRQEYQWARSAMVLVTVYLGKWWPGRLTLLEMFRVIQCNLFWIVQSATALFQMAAVHGPCLFGLQLLPGLDHSLAALALQCTSHMLPLFVLNYSNWLFCYLNGWMRPVETRFFSYEMFLHAFCKPWWILQGTVHGLLGALMGITFAIQVTPKGDNGEVLMGPKNIIPFLACSTACIIALAAGSSHFLVPLSCCCCHLMAAAAIVALHYRENHCSRKGRGRGKFPLLNFLQLTVPLVVSLAAMCVVLLVRRHRVFTDIVLGQQAVTAAAVADPPATAGRGAAEFGLDWMTTESNALCFGDNNTLKECVAFTA